MAVMAMESSGANIILIDEGWLVPRALDVTTPHGGLPEITMETVSILVGTDREAVDVLQDWESNVPDHYKPIGLTLKERNKLQRSRLFLRNRRIVGGYELLDRQLRVKLGGGNADAVPPTWLTIGKWTAKTIGDLLYGDIPIPQQRWSLRKPLRFLLRLHSQLRTLAMGRILILGNREIFAQVASALITFTNKDFDEKGLNFLDFAGKYGKTLLGQNHPDIAYELPFPISAATRDPLSDSMLRALHSYYRAIDASPEQERTTWVLTGNLHLAAYEQHVAQTFLDLGLKLRTRKALSNLLDGFKLQNVPPAESARNRPLDMVTEARFAVRLIDLAAAAFVTRYILSIRIGPADEYDMEPDQVFAPANPLHQCNEADETITKLIDRNEVGENPAGESLRRIWFALDRAAARPDRCRVRDWRNYASRISYIANLFTFSINNNSMFNQPALSIDELHDFLAGRLPKKDGIPLNPAQCEVVRSLKDAKKSPPGFDAAA
jgi:hypothetical protein